MVVGLSLLHDLRNGGHLGGQDRRGLTGIFTVDHARRCSALLC